MKEEKSVVIENTNINSNYYLMKVRNKYIATTARPGNFVMVAVSDSYDPLLKRPFGIYRIQEDVVVLYYQVIGKGTQLMSQLKSGDQVALLGPLGNSFLGLSGKKILLIAGGRGIAPIFFALEHYQAHNDVRLLYGARSAGDLNLLDEIKAINPAETYLYTEDGSVGKKGLLTDDLGTIIKDHGIQVTVSCGPDAMFESLSHHLKGLDCTNYASLEAMMGCGFGICYSCAVKMVNGNYKKVCSDGPVFLLEDVQW